MNNNVETLTKMITQLPENMQEKVIEELKAILSEAMDEARWKQLYQDTPSKLSEMAQKVRSQISSGQAKSMDYDRL